MGKKCSNYFQKCTFLIFMCTLFVFCAEILMQLLEINAHEIQFDAFNNWTMMTEPMALKAVEVVVEITSYFHLELVVVMTVLLETLH